MEARLVGWLVGSCATEDDVDFDDVGGGGDFEPTSPKFIGNSISVV